MKNYAESERFTPEDMQYFVVAQVLVEQVPAKCFGEWVRCHELTRAVAAVMGLEDQVRDGKCMGVEHSWIELRVHGTGCVILDLYAPGRMPQVQLVDVHLMVNKVYYECPIALTVRSDELAWIIDILGGN